MAPRVHSTLFFSGEVVPGNHDAYLVPEGFVAVLKDVAALNLSVLGLQVILGSWPDNVNWTRLVVPAGIGESNTWQGGQVFPAGYKMTLDLVGEGVVRMSGFLLTAP